MPDQCNDPVSSPRRTGHRQFIGSSSGWCRRSRGFRDPGVTARRADAVDPVNPAQRPASLPCCRSERRASDALARQVVCLAFPRAASAGRSFGEPGDSLEVAPTMQPSGSKSGRWAALPTHPRTAPGGTLGSQPQSALSGQARWERTAGCLPEHRAVRAGRLYRAGAPEVGPADLPSGEPAGATLQPSGNGAILAAIYREA